MNSVLKQSHDAVANVNVALLDQFIEGVRDATLWRVLCKLLRDKPVNFLIEVRDKALMWPLEDPKLCANKVALNGSKASKALNHNVISEATEA